MTFPKILRKSPYFCIAFLGSDIETDRQTDRWQEEGRLEEDTYRFHSSIFNAIHLPVSAHISSTLFKSLLPFNVFLVSPFKINLLKYKYKITEIICMPLTEFSKSDHTHIIGFSQK